MTSKFIQTKRNERILIIGAGVNGSVCAEALHKSGTNVTVLARGKRYENIKNNGIIFENPVNHQQNIIKVPVISSLEPEDIYNYILVVIRSNQVSELLPILAANKSPNVVFMFNNLCVSDEYVRVLGKERIMLGFVFGVGNCDGNIVYTNSKRRLRGVPFGEIDGKLTSRLIQLVELFQHAELDAKASLHVVDYLVFHASFVVILACTHIKNTGNKKAITADIGLMADALREMFTVLKTLGYKITPFSYKIYFSMPRFMLTTMLRIFVNTKIWDIFFTDLAMPQTTNEMLQIAKELKGLVVKSGLSAPAMNKILSIQ